MKRISILLALAFFYAAPASAQTIAFPVHGNWCGTKHTGGPVLDKLDAACMRHDFCTEDAGQINCGCDLLFMHELRTMTWPSHEAYERGRAIYEAISLSPCAGPRDQRKLKREWACNDHRGAVARGREEPGRAFERLVELVGVAIANAYVIHERKPPLLDPEDLSPEGGITVATYVEYAPAE